MSFEKYSMTFEKYSMSIQKFSMSFGRLLRGIEFLRRGDERGGTVSQEKIAIAEAPKDADAG